MRPGDEYEALYITQTYVITLRPILVAVGKWVAPAVGIGCFLAYLLLEDGRTLNGIQEGARDSQDTQIGT